MTCLSRHLPKSQYETTWASSLLALHYSSAGRRRWCRQQPTSPPNSASATLVIGLTVVAIGTSLPEVATSVLAALRGERDLAVGNAIGSNLFNLLAVLGVTASVSPNVIPVAQGAIQVDIPVMIAVAVACLPIFANGHVLARWEGALFFLFYIGYIAWLILDAADHSVRSDYGNVMLYFVIPITALTLTVIGVRSQRKELSAR